MATWLETNAINFFLRNQAVTAPTTVYVSVHTGDPGDTGASEVTGGSMARQLCTFTSPGSGNTTDNNANLEWDFTGQGASKTITYLGYWSAVTAGNFLGNSPLTSSVVMAVGQTMRIPTGDLDVTVVTRG